MTACLQLRALRDHLQGETDRRVWVEEQLRNLNHRVQVSEASKDCLEQDNTRLRADLSARDHRQATVERDLSVAKQELEGFRAQLQALEERMVAKDKGVRLLEVRNEELETEYRKFSESADEKCSSLETRLGACLNELTSTQAENIRLAEERDDFKRRGMSADQQLVETMAELVDIRNRVRMDSESQKEQHNETKRLRNEVQEMAARVQEIQGDLNEAHEKLKESSWMHRRELEQLLSREEHIEIAMEQRCELEMQLAEATETSAKLSIEVAELKESLESQSKALSALKIQNKELEFTLANSERSHEAESEGTKLTVESLSSQIKSLTDKISSMEVGHRKELNSFASREEHLELVMDKTAHLEALLAETNDALTVQQEETEQLIEAKRALETLVKEDQERCQEALDELEAVRQALNAKVELYDAEQQTDLQMPPVVEDVPDEVEEEEGPVEAEEDEEDDGDMGAESTQEDRSVIELSDNGDEEEDEEGSEFEEDKEDETDVFTELQVEFLDHERRMSSSPITRSGVGALSPTTWGTPMRTPGGLPRRRTEPVQVEWASPEGGQTGKRGFVTPFDGGPPTLTRGASWDTPHRPKISRRTTGRCGQTNGLVDLSLIPTSRATRQLKKQVDAPLNTKRHPKCMNHVETTRSGCRSCSALRRRTSRTAKKPQIPTVKEEAASEPVIELRTSPRTRRSSKEDMNESPQLPSTAATTADTTPENKVTSVNDSLLPQGKGEGPVDTKKRRRKSHEGTTGGDLNSVVHTETADNPSKKREKRPSTRDRPNSVKCVQ